MLNRLLATSTLLFTLTILLNAQDQTLVPFGSNWKYLDDGSNQGNAWRYDTFDDNSWAAGPAELGYGEGDESTVVSFGPNSSDKYITTYFRHTFNISDVNAFTSFLVRLKKDDGALVFINGYNVMRSNFGTGSYDYQDEAYSSISGSEEDIIWEEFIDPSHFQTGTNLIAVEVHQRDPGSSDLSFDFELIGYDSDAEIYRYPYIQRTSESEATIKWKTNAPTTSKVDYGTSPGGLTNTESNAVLTQNHEIRITGLSDDTKYYYKVGNGTVDYTTANSSRFFVTNPVIGTSIATRIWVTGDAGTGKTGQYDVRDAYLNYAGTQGKADLWLMMGDNAYEHGREADYQMGLFDVYDSILQNTVSFPTSGNHDFYGEASPVTQTGPYFDIFALPKDGESGGVASGTEAYYSYDYGDIHFVALESYDLNRDSTAAMATWLKSDLQNTNAKWLIAYWHYAPYTKVGHDSDDPNDHSGRAIEMREYFNPILERHGIDLVLAGHSHGYERSYLIDGHYGFSTSLVPAMIKDGTSGNANSTGAYLKPDGLKPHFGAVYAVCGSSGKLSSAGVNHPAMYTTNTDFHGSMIIDVVGDTLEGKFLNENGIIQDYFHIVKGVFSGVENQVGKLAESSISPNPASDVLRITSDVSVTQAGSVQIYAISGELQKSVSYNGGTQTIDVSQLAAGTYTVKVLVDGILSKSQLLVIQ